MRNTFRKLSTAIMVVVLCLFMMPLSASAGEPEVRLGYIDFDLADLMSEQNIAPRSSGNREVATGCFRRPQTPRARRRALSPNCRKQCPRIARPDKNVYTVTQGGAKRYGLNS
jgi:hypothetical protein